MERHGWCIHSSVKSVFFFGQPLICLHCRLIYLGNLIRSLDMWTHLLWTGLCTHFTHFPRWFSRVGVCQKKKKKIWGDGATGFIIVPTWPTQSYFGSLLSMLVDQPLYFKTTRTTLTSPSVRELTYPLRVTLSVCSVRQSLVECGIFDRSCRRHSVSVEYS